MLKEAIGKIGEIKHSKLILLACVIGILLMLFGSGFFDRNEKNSGTDYEKDIKELCRKIVDEDIYVTVNTNSANSLAGVALVLKGGEDSLLKLKLTQAISVLYSIPTSKIYVTAPCY